MCRWCRSGEIVQAVQVYASEGGMQEGQKQEARRSVGQTASMFRANLKGATFYRYFCKRAIRRRPFLL